jgi:hypothetical protein
MRIERTNLSSSVDHDFPALAKALRFWVNPHSFIFSYAMNWRAPLLTPNSARDVPLYSPRIPSNLYVDESPSETKEINFASLSHFRTSSGEYYAYAISFGTL